MKVSVSVLNLKEKNKLKEIENCHPDFIHIDVMDNKFVDNFSYPIEEVKDIVDDFNYDVHLMVNDVKKYVDDFKTINPKSITFHVELDNTLELINYIKKQNIKVGLALNPKTDIKLIYPYLNLVDLVLVMSVEPGKGGQEFIMSSLDKINNLYEYRKKYNLNYEISVDGGVNDKTIKYLNLCDIVVSGSFVTNGDFENKINILRGEL